jgi:hypothetical protein
MTMEKSMNFTDEDEKQLLNYELNKLHERYDTKIYDEAFKNFPLTPRQDSDASWWRFYEIKLLKLMEVDKNYRS